MAGTLKVGGVSLATHSSSTGLVSLESGVSFHNKLVKIEKNAIGTPLNNTFIAASSNFAWSASAIELDYTPMKSGNLLIIHGFNSGYIDLNDGRLRSTFLISQDNGASFINVASDINGMNMKDSSNNAFDHLTHFYHYNTTDFGVGGGSTKGYYTVQNTNPMKIRLSHRCDKQFRYYAPCVMFVYEHEVVS